MSYKNIALFVMAALLCLPVSADTLTLNPDHPEKYVVQKGDTLWDISGRFLNEQWRWPELWNNNPQIENPHLIYPGDELSVVFRDGQPALQVRRAGAAGMTADAGSVKLSPSVRESALKQAVPTIPIDAISPFLSRPMVVGEDELDAAPYVLSAQDGRVVAGAGDTIYARGLSDDAAVDYGIFRRGKPYINERVSRTDVLGYEALHIGDARLTRGGDPSTLVVVRSSREVLDGDRLVPVETTGFNRNFKPRVPAGEIEGNIIAVVDGVSQIGQFQVVVIDRGSNDGLEPGHVLGIFQSGIVVRDRHAKTEPEGKPDALLDLANNVAKFFRKSERSEEVELPEERAGVLMVFRTYERVSYALVMETSRPARRYDTVRRP